MTGTRWEVWLEELRGLAADAPEWQAWEQFQAAVVRLATARHAEREAARASWTSAWPG